MGLFLGQIYIVVLSLDSGYIVQLLTTKTAVSLTLRVERSVRHSRCYALDLVDER